MEPFQLVGLHSTPVGVASACGHLRPHVGEGRSERVEVEQAQADRRLVAGEDLHHELEEVGVGFEASVRAPAGEHGGALGGVGNEPEGVGLEPLEVVDDEQVWRVADRRLDLVGRRGKHRAGRDHRPRGLALGQPRSQLVRPARTPGADDQP